MGALGHENNILYQGSLGGKYTQLPIVCGRYIWGGGGGGFQGNQYHWKVNAVILANCLRANKSLNGIHNEARYSALLKKYWLPCIFRCGLGMRLESDMFLKLWQPNNS